MKSAFATNYLHPKLSNSTQDIFIFFHFSGVVQCLKLSPNLRKQAPEVEAATFLANTKKVFALEQKILSNILEMTKVPEKDTRTTHET